jgi:hypothetical protein
MFERRMAGYGLCRKGRLDLFVGLEVKRVNPLQILDSVDIKSPLAFH